MTGGATGRNLVGLPAEPARIGPGFRRPVIIIQADAFNRSAIRTVLVVVLTSKMHLVDVPGNIRLNRRVTGFPKPSVANVSQVLTVIARP